MNLGVQRNPSIFIIDDDGLVLSSLRTLFSLETDYEVLDFSDPLSAIRQLEQTPVDLVISDYLMPKMNGIDLLREVRRRQPEAARILLTGYADKENAIRAINEVGLYQYLEKPWDNQEMLIVIRNALQEKNLRQRLSEKVKELDRLLSEHHALRDSHGDLIHELEMAGRVQQSLFPSEFPEIEGFRFNVFYQPCRLVGGDYYDFAVESGRTIILVSDVSGHGVQAALTNMLLKAIFQEAARQVQELAQVLTEMNSRLFKFLPTGMFVAATLLCLEQHQPRILVANAGLPYPFVLRQSERRLDEVTLAGLPLGMFEGGGDERYDMREVNLASGDVLLVASDGLGEVRGVNEEFFQDYQLRQALGEFYGKEGSELIKGVMGRATQFTGSQQLPDDVTMLAITRI